MSPDLPQHIEPARLADNAESLEGKLGIGNMRRLLAVVDKCDSCITFHLSFSKNEAGDVVVINGDFSTKLTMQCQRCLEPLVISLEKAIRIACVTDISDAGTLAADLEPLQLNEGRILLVELIEDEVLLGLPMAPVHNPDECPATELLEALREEKESPFAILKKLKADKH